MHVGESLVSAYVRQQALLVQSASFLLQSPQAIDHPRILATKHVQETSQEDSAGRIVAWDCVRVHGTARIQRAQSGAAVVRPLQPSPSLLGIVITEEMFGYDDIDASSSASQPKERRKRLVDGCKRALSLPNYQTVNAHTPPKQSQLPVAYDIVDGSSFLKVLDRSPVRSHDTLEEMRNQAREERSSRKRLRAAIAKETASQPKKHARKEKINTLKAPPCNIQSIQDFLVPNIPKPKRISVPKRLPTYGIYNKGRRSEKPKAIGAPDLAFSESHFLDTASSVRVPLVLQSQTVKLSENDKPRSSQVYDTTKSLVEDICSDNGVAKSQSAYFSKAMPKSVNRETSSRVLPLAPKPNLQNTSTSFVKLQNATQTTTQYLEKATQCTSQLNGEPSPISKLSNSISPKQSKKCITTKLCTPEPKLQTAKESNSCPENHTNLSFNGSPMLSTTRRVKHLLQHVSDAMDTPSYDETDAQSVDENSINWSNRDTVMEVVKELSTTENNDIIHSQQPHRSCYQSHHHRRPSNMILDESTYEQTVEHSSSQHCSRRENTSSPINMQTDRMTHHDTNIASEIAPEVEYILQYNNSPLFSRHSLHSRPITVNANDLSTIHQPTVRSSPNFSTSSSFLSLLDADYVNYDTTSPKHHVLHSTLAMHASAHHPIHFQYRQHRLH